MENHSTNEHDTNEFAHKHNREEKPDAGRCLHLWAMMMLHKWKICLIAIQLLDVRVHGGKGFKKAEWNVMANAEMGMQARTNKRKRLSQRNFPFDKWKKKIITVKVTRPQLWLRQHAVGAQKGPGRAPAGPFTCRDGSAWTRAPTGTSPTLTPPCTPFLEFTQGAGSLSLFHHTSPCWPALASSFCWFCCYDCGEGKRWG